MKRSIASGWVVLALSAVGLFTAACSSSDSSDEPAGTAGAGGSTAGAGGSAAGAGGSAAGAGGDAGAGGSAAGAGGSTAGAGGSAAGAGGSAAGAGGSASNLQAPIMQSASPVSGAVHVAWKNVQTDCDKIELNRSKDGGAYAVAYTLTGAATSQHDTQATPPGKYCYTALCKKGTDVSPLSNEKCTP